ncbi:heavy-metal-associated domain-containing protein [Actinomycetota bacterium]
MDVQGMHCQRCNTRVSHTLLEVKGVAKVVIDSGTAARSGDRLGHAA